VKLDAQIELSGPAFLPQLARRLAKKGVDDTPATLKQILEAVRVPRAAKSCARRQACEEVDPARPARGPADLSGGRARPPLSGGRSQAVGERLEHLHLDVWRAPEQ
jgi:hypothetical protein